jgi:hypothetical protein
MLQTGIVKENEKLEYVEKNERGWSEDMIY